MIKENTTHRRIKSYVKREGRFTPAQEKACLTYWPQYGLEITSEMIAPAHMFGREAPIIIEIGFGMGASLLETAEQHPDWNFIGIEVHRPGVGAFLRQANEKGLNNIRVYCHDAVEVLKYCIPNDSIDRFCIFFPDPWPKKRHHKRRLIQKDFIDLLTHKLKPHGTLHLATDWEDYATHMLSILDQCPDLVNESPTNTYVERPITRPTTKYERRGEKLGHTVRDLVFIKNTVE